jgi:hypothetical protein
MSELLEKHHFEPLIGKTVQVKGTRFSFPLSRSITKEKAFPTSKRDPFILIFRAPRENEYLPEGRYQCAFDGGPTYEFYVAPTLTPEPEWQDYQAIFN